ncbi:MAG: hypothetical protein K2L46_00920 [Paramuribaculum sp.]|nr:hypothetical protein [Paramuribaculum sp.]
MKLHKTLLTTSAILLSASLSHAVEKADSLSALADKAPANTSLSFRAGRALYEAGHNRKALPYLNRGGNDANPWIALIELEDYNFEAAAARAEKYLASKHDATAPEHSLAEEIIDRAGIGRTMLDRVEKVIVIDSLTVDKESFFRAYSISPTTGTIASPTALPGNMKAARPTTVYVSENGERMLWGQYDKNGNSRIVETNHLADGSWEAPEPIGDDLCLGANANFPFLLSDGMTLYYASDGEGSLGGYDIYVTRNDGDRYLNPQNIGMPYNSPMDDYLLAIDDATGIGWWATDRNLIPGKLTIYMFIPQELRDNYPVDGTPDLIQRARISSIAKTHRQGEDYSKYFEAVRNIMKNASSDTTDGNLMFALPDGRVINRISDLTQPEAAELMREYLSAYDEFTDRKIRLLSLRQKYREGNTSLTDEILSEEAELEQMQTSLRNLANEVISAETGM